MSDCIHSREFNAATIVLPVINETTSLRQTVDILLQDVKRDDIRELLIVTGARTTPAALATIAQLQRELGDLLVVHRQQLPFLGGALREAFDLARGSHVIMMASDLETDPKDVPVLIAEARKHPAMIVTASRWQGQARFHGYSRIKLICNWLFQHFFSLLYQTHLTDMTFAYRIFPTGLVQSIHWEDLRHSFLFETLVKPLRLGVSVIEIPSIWRARPEGESQNSFFRNFAYFKTGIRARFARCHLLLKPDAQAVSDEGRPPF